MEEDNGARSLKYYKKKTWQARLLYSAKVSFKN